MVRASGCTSYSSWCFQVFYDIRGEVLADEKWIPFTDQRAFNNAYLWGKPQP